MSKELGLDTATESVILTGQAQDNSSIEDRIENALFGEADKGDQSDGENLPGDNPGSEAPNVDDDDGDAGDLQPGDKADEGDSQNSESGDDELTLSDYLGIDDDRVIEKEDGVYFIAKVDGEEKEVPLKELAVSYQMLGHVNNKSMALESDRNEFEQKAQATMSQLSNQFQQAGQMLSQAKDALLSDLNSIDWQSLYQNEPQMYVQLREQYNIRMHKISEIENGLTSAVEGANEDYQDQMRSRQEAYAKAELTKVIAKNPTWADDSVRESEQAKMRDFLKAEYGFEENDLKAVSDHRIIQVILDAQKYHLGTKAAAGKLDKKVPNFTKPGGSKAQISAAAKARGVKAKKSRLQKSGSIDDAAALLIDRI